MILALFDANSQNSIISFDYSWFSAKNLSNIVSHPWKLHKPYCYNTRYPETWFKFGNSNKGNGFKGSWILFDPLENDYLTWRLNKWHHICFSYSKQTSHISLVRVRFKLQYKWLKKDYRSKKIFRKIKIRQ